MKFDDATEVRGHRRTEAEQKSLRDKFIARLRQENYGGGNIPQHELERALKAVGLWQHRGRAA